MTEVTAWSQTDASNNSAAPAGAPENMAPSGLNDTMRAMQGGVARRYARGDTPTTTAGTATAYTVTYAVAPTAYSNGETFLVQFNQACGASPTININALGALPIHKYSAAGTWGVLSASDVLTDTVVVLAYNSAAGSMRIIASSFLIPSAGIVTNAMLANMTGPAFKGRTSGTGVPADVAAQLISGVVLDNYLGIGGLTYANSPGDLTNDIDIAVGGAIDATGVYWMTLATAITKRLDAAWAVGTNQGGLDTGSIANVDYYKWLIARSDTGVVDVLFSASGTAPTMPGSYDYKRLIGYFRRTGAAILPFLTYEIAGGGIEYRWVTALNSVNLANTLTTSRHTDALSVPLAFSVIAHVRVTSADSTATYYGIVCCPDETDAAPGQTTPGASFVSVSAGFPCHYSDYVRTSSAGLVASRVNITSGAAPIDTFIIITDSFQWSRR